MLARQFRSISPDTNQDVTFRVTPLERARSRHFEDYRTPLFILQALVAMLLLIACSNLASLLLTRAMGRARELGVRAALGARRGLLVREMLLESLVLGLAGGALGLLLAQWSLALFRSAVDNAGLRIPRLEFADVDGTVVVFTFGLSIITALLFGILPALRASSWGIGEALKEGSRSLCEGPGRSRLRSGLVVGQVALCLILLSCAGLMARSFWLMTRVDVGFELEGLGVSFIQLHEGDYPDPRSRAAFYERIVASAGSVQGVESAALIDYPPFLGGRARPFSGGKVQDDGGHLRLTQLRSISEGYFGAMKIKLTRGRAFSADDLKLRTSVAIVSQSIARLCWPGEEAVGRTMTVDDRPVRVIGVAADVKSTSPTSPVEPLVYVPYGNDADSHIYLVTRFRRAPAGYEEKLLAQLRTLDPNQLVQAVSMTQTIEWTRGTHRLFMILLAIFAAAALLITVLGGYGTVSFMAARRTHEIGLRMALGADSASILKLILRQGLIVAALGLAIGLPAALVLTMPLRSFLFGVTSTDPLTYGIVGALLGGTVLLASYLPARRAAGLNPLESLREE